jgi:hypothetical protein
MAIDPRAKRYGELAAEKLLAGRKGHGGGPCMRRNLTREELIAVCASAFEAGMIVANRESAQ